MTLRNGVYPVIVQLVSEKDEVVSEVYAENPKILDFLNISPGNYTIRVVFDTNKNRIYDAGNYLNKTRPERVSYYPEIIEIRAGWDWVNEFILSD